MTAGQLELPLFADEREQVRRMELRTYDCGSQREFHDPHPVAGGMCPGLRTRACGSQRPHDWHRWWDIDVAFYWCNGVHRTRSIEDVELP